MVAIAIDKGLDIPIMGSPQTSPQKLIPSGQSKLANPQLIALDFRPYTDLRFALHKKVGDYVKIGEPIAEDRSTQGRLFVSPAAGVIKEVRRGLKRRLLDIVIEVQYPEEYQEWDSMDPNSSLRESIIERLLIGGLFSRIYVRPLKRLADPTKLPRSIFVKAIESAPFVPPAEMQVAGHEREFQAGLDALAKLTEGKVHLVHRAGSTFKPFTEAKNVVIHTAQGPHPVANHSLHIQRIDPIRSVDDIVWTLTAHDVVAAGYLLLHGRYHIERIVSIAGPGVLPDQVGYFQVREGFPISALVAGRIPHGIMRYISGDPLMGEKVEAEDFLGAHHFAFTVIPEDENREFMHFFRLGGAKYSFTRAYLSGHRNNSHRVYPFTTSQHGEHRAFIEPTIYDEVMPLAVPTKQLIQAVVAEDFELAAESLGFLDVDGEDFALPTFICPSKIEMVEIINKGIKRYREDMLS